VTIQRRDLLLIGPRGNRAVERKIREEVGRATDGDEVRAISTRLKADRVRIRE
jgi:hypothetical protein